MVDKDSGVAEKIRSGEFFRESRSMYDAMVHDMMAERYFYVFVSVISGLILLMAIVAVNGLYPLKKATSFIVNSNDIIDERPSIRSLIVQKGEDPSVAVLRFVAQNYVKLREEYDITIFERNQTGVKSQSSDEVFNEYLQETSPSNPESPIAQFQRHSRRNVNVLYTRRTSDNTIEVTYEAFVITKTEAKKSLWQSNLTFNYSGIALDQDSGKVSPFTFMVTGYKVKRLQDSK